MHIYFNTFASFWHFCWSYFYFFNANTDVISICSHVGCISVAVVSDCHTLTGLSAARGGLFSYSWLNWRLSRVLMCNSPVGLCISLCVPCSCTSNPNWLTISEHVSYRFWSRVEMENWLVCKQAGQWGQQRDSVSWEEREITALWRGVKWKWIGFVNVLIKAEKRSVKNVSAGCDSNPLKGCLPVKVKCNVMERTLSECFSPERAGNRSNPGCSLDLSHCSYMLVMSRWHQQQSASPSLQPPGWHFA